MQNNIGEYFPVKLIRNLFVECRRMKEIIIKTMSEKKKNKNPRGDKSGGKKRKQKTNTKRKVEPQELLSWKDKKKRDKERSLKKPKLDQLRNYEIE